VIDYSLRETCLAHFRGFVQVWVCGDSSHAFRSGFYAPDRLRLHGSLIFDAPGSRQTLSLFKAI
jgi:hypothetical protein